VANSTLLALPSVHSERGNIATLTFPIILLNIRYAKLSFVY
jgi:hypothetical protein